MDESGRKQMKVDNSEWQLMKADQNSWKIMKVDESGLMAIKGDERGWKWMNVKKGGTKGLQRQRLIGSAVAGFNNARTITKASATGLDTRQDDYNKGNCSPASLVNSSVR